MKLGKISNIHLIGIGGIGMSGIAEILLNQDFTVSGSDLSHSENTAQLEAKGVKVFYGHDEKNIVDAHVVVYSSAVAKDNVELQGAKKQGIPVIRRAEMLAELTRLHYCIGVAGTHGKTTTTSILGVMLIQAGLDPTVIVGGKLHAFGGTNARLGKGEYMVVEADEYDRSFLQLNPTMAILTTVEEEHLDIYRDIEDLKQSFTEFANKVPFYGFVVLCMDDDVLQEVYARIDKPVITYGLSSQADYQAIGLTYEKQSTKFTLRVYGVNQQEFHISLPGDYNVRNTLGAIAVAHQLGVPLATIAESISDFKGAYRRFDVKGTFQDVLVVDDYAHHPTEVRETLQGIRNAWDNRVVCVFQPHTYTRTRDFSAEFGKSFLNCDVLVVTDVYPAREEKIQGIDGALIAQSAIDHGHKNVHYVEKKEGLTDELNKLVTKDDIVIFMGAGDIYKQIDKYIENQKLNVD